VYFQGRKVLQFDTNLFLADGHFEQGCTVYGQEGNIYIPRAFTQIELLRFAKMVETGIYVSDHTIGKGHTEEISIGAVHQWRLEAEYFAGRILSGDPIDLPAENGAANMKVLDALVRSAGEGMPVDV
jgi:predicted dehydrogenase